ncbi:MAG: hypothetical protein SGILL_005941 [Bacillariaceae sp.]
MRASWILGVVSTALLLVTTTAVEDTHLQEAQQIFNWISGSTGGYITPKQELRRAVPGDTSTPLGVYAKKPIQAGEVIARIPWQTIIKSSDPEDEGQMACGLVRAVAREMKLGERSDYAPYAVYLNSEPYGQIPSAWSDPGKKLLVDVLQDHLYPDAPVAWITEDWYGRCGGDPRDKISTKAAMLVVQRSDDEIMIPAYDAYNHRNGNWTNAAQDVIPKKYHETTASRDIQVGEQVLISYDKCEECGGRHFGYGTADMLRDYGFIEYFPQRWHFINNEIEFDLDEDENGELELRWIEQPRPHDLKSREQIKIELKWEIQRLRRFKNIDWKFSLKERYHGIPRHELDTIWQFVDANIIAMSVALEALGPMTTTPITTTKADADQKDDVVETVKLESPKQKCADDAEGSCSASALYEDLAPFTGNGSHYDPLNWEFDDLDYQASTCDNREIMKFHDFYQLEVSKTSYQQMTFLEKPSTDDVCMDLDKIVQICANYRPQYHEYGKRMQMNEAKQQLTLFSCIVHTVTHAAARYIKDVRRIIFIGGGDSMLLHEALKYPNLEKVVGLELDQTVTRKCFKYFKTSPHFDDPRVEWWFGDATKSLLLLPEEYWGSFDLVLVDLSETVVSFSVTKELDVFDAMALLLSPQGVLVKNEHYMEKLSSAFDYSVELFYESPVICSQTLAFGSNTVDFFHAPVYDHGVETKLYGTMHTPNTRFDLMHDYRKNIAPKEKCELNIPELPAVQEKTAGILEIVNAERTGDSLADDVSSALKSVVEKQGFSVSFDPTYAHETSVVVMSEGYVAARTWPEDNYVSFDIYLWSKTYKIEALKHALVQAVGSQDVSSYKVVVGGMFGSESWKEDQKIIGPKLKQLRNCDKDTVTSGDLDPNVASAIAFEEVLPLTLSKHVTVAVVCGNEQDDCVALKALQSHVGIKHVIPIYDCPGIADDETLAFACEAQVVENLKSEVAKSKSKVNLLIMDPSSSYKMHQIVASISSIGDLRLELMAGHFVAASWMTDMTETWRRDLIDRFRKQFHFDPTSHAEILFQYDGKAHQLGIFSSNNDGVNYEYNRLEDRLRDRLSDSKATIELRKVHGALYRFKDQWKPKIFKQSDYNSDAAEKQFRTQLPIGRQNVFQLVKAHDFTGELDLSLEKLAAHLKEAMTGVHMLSNETQQFASKDLGEGGVIVSLSPIGDVILVWDGREHVDISLFTDEEFNGLPEKFIGHLFHLLEGSMIVALRDDQPRGIGHVINFPSDLEDEDDDESDLVEDDDEDGED